VPAVAGETRVAGVQAYQGDAIVRHAVSLQRTREARAPRVVYGAGAES
jgi:ribosomal protein L25 (general stress protein Ctc)